MKRTPLRRVSPNKVIKPKVKKSKKPKKLSSAKLKKKLDAVFSIYVRRFHSRNDMASCYTCGKIGDWKSMQCGHFISRSYLATRFDENNVRIQCIGCNVFGNGQTVEFARKLEIEKEGIVARLYRKAQQITKDYPYAEKIEYYENKIRELEA